MNNKYPIGNHIKSLLLMEVSWHMWKTNKNFLLKKTMISILSQLCTVKKKNVTKAHMENVIRNSKCYREDNNENIFFAKSHFMPYFLAKRLFLTLRKAKAKPIYKLLNTRYFDNETLYFLSLLDQEENCIHRTLQKVLMGEYIENVTENALHIYSTTLQLKQKFQLQQAKDPFCVTNYNFTQNLDFSLEVQNNTFHSDNSNIAKNFFDKGLQLLKENKNFEALEFFFTAKVLDPSCIKAANNLAIVFKNLGCVPIAKEMAQRVLMAAPDNYRAKQHLKYLEKFENKPKELTDSALNE